MTPQLVLATNEEIEAFVRDFEACTLPKVSWHHHAHLVVGLWYLTRHSPEEALHIVRQRIRAYNEVVGPPNTDTSGYHETLTRFYLQGIAQQLAKHPGKALPESLAQLLASPIADKGWPLAAFSRERLFSVEARRHWVEPDLHFREPLIVRLEMAHDFGSIRAIHEAAFPSHGEADLVDRLRADSDLVLSLVAVLDNEVVGHVAFSKMRWPSDSLGLAPVAVLARHRRRGIAASLIRDGLKRAKDASWKGAFVLGNPAYYNRFGFDPALTVGLISPFAGPHLMAVTLRGDAADLRKGRIEYARAFTVLE